HREGRPARQEVLLDRRRRARVRGCRGDRLPRRQPRPHLGHAHPPRSDQLQVVRRAPRAPVPMALDFEHARSRMIEEQLEARGFGDAAVLAAMRQVPRHLFVAPALRDRAYEDTPLPIGERQTISQPYMVALMSEALELVPGARVLEVGTGSGYQAAVLAEMGARVVSLERIPRLAARAHEVLAGLGYGDRVTVEVADGTLGWLPGAPYDAIVVTAGARSASARPTGWPPGGAGGPTASRTRTASRGAG